MLITKLFLQYTYVKFSAPPPSGSNIVVSVKRCNPITAQFLGMFSKLGFDHYPFAPLSPPASTLFLSSLLNPFEL